jgi:hypothetical protein
MLSHDHATVRASAWEATPWAQSCGETLHQVSVIAGPNFSQKKRAPVLRGTQGVKRPPEWQPKLFHGAGYRTPNVTSVMCRVGEQL